jgi:hypothetical protein
MVRQPHAGSSTDRRLTVDSKERDDSTPQRSVPVDNGTTYENVVKWIWKFSFVGSNPSPPYLTWPQHFLQLTVDVIYELFYNNLVILCLRLTEFGCLVGPRPTWESYQHLPRFPKSIVPATFDLQQCGYPWTHPEPSCGGRRALAGTNLQWTVPELGLLHSSVAAASVRQRGQGEWQPKLRTLRWSPLSSSVPHRHQESRGHSIPAGNCREPPPRNVRRPAGRPTDRMTDKPGRSTLLELKSTDGLVTSDRTDRLLGGAAEHRRHLQPLPRPRQMLRWNDCKTVSILDTRKVNV